MLSARPITLVNRVGMWLAGCETGSSAAEVSGLAERETGETKR
jgi:hypothetical protein